jgi:alkanesulfonate monooxygenase SsuD/methylene tetrahydromethanopterin reductase-like flavin-dependent oxidoreductase (luciferase family)
VARLEEGSPSCGRCGAAAGLAAVAVLSARRRLRPPDRRPPPRILIGGETRAGARLAGRLGDGWSTFDDNFEANLPAYLEALEASGRRREDQLVLVGVQGDWLDDARIAGSPWVVDPRATWERWRAAGADGAVLTAKSTEDVDALVEAVERW